jgi:hypothetical protein
MKNNVKLFGQFITKLRKKSFTAPGQDFIQAEGFFLSATKASDAKIASDGVGK